MVSDSVRVYVWVMVRLKVLNFDKIDIRRFICI